MVFISFVFVCILEKNKKTTTKKREIKTEKHLHKDKII